MKPLKDWFACLDCVILMECNSIRMSLLSKSWTFSAFCYQGTRSKHDWALDANKRQIKSNAICFTLKITEITLIISFDYVQPCCCCGNLVINKFLKVFNFSRITLNFTLRVILLLCTRTSVKNVNGLFFHPTIFSCNIHS